MSLWFSSPRGFPSRDQGPCGQVAAHGEITTTTERNPKGQGDGEKRGKTEGQGFSLGGLLVFWEASRVRWGFPNMWHKGEGQRHRGCDPGQILV